VTCRQVSADISATLSACVMPALLTRMVTVPNAFSAVSKARQHRRAIEHVGFGDDRLPAGRHDLCFNAKAARAARDQHVLRAVFPARPRQSAPQARLDAPVTSATRAGDIKKVRMISWRALPFCA